MTDRPRSEKAIFLAALVMDQPGERAAYLDQACAGNADLRAHVEALLAANKRFGSHRGIVPDARAGGTVADEPVVERAGSYVGPYKLLQQIGEGGMGSVWMAEQSFPVQRKVALKLIKSGSDDRPVIARFEAE